MDLYEKIKELASQKNVSIRRVEEELGFANGSLKQWKTSNPGADKLKKIAKYFHISVDYLLGIDDEKGKFAPVDIADLISDDDVDWDKWISFDGKPICDEDKQILKRIFGNQLKD